MATGKRLSLDDGNVAPLVPTAKGLMTIMAREGKNTTFSVSEVIANKHYDPIRWAVPSGRGNSQPVLLDYCGRHHRHGRRGQRRRKQRGGSSFELATGRRLTQFTVPGTYQFPQPPFSPCGRWVVVNGKVLQLKTGTEVFAPKGGDGERIVASTPQAHGPVWFSPDGGLLAGLVQKAGDVEPPDTLGLVGSSVGQTAPPHPQSRSRRPGCLSPDRRRLALVDGRGVHLYEVTTGKLLTTFAATDMVCFLLAPG